MSMSGKFFRPPPPGAVDDDDDSSDEDDDSYNSDNDNNKAAAGGDKGGQQQQSSANLSESEEEEEDDDDDDDEEEDDEPSRKRKRSPKSKGGKAKKGGKKKKGGVSFFDEEAEVEGSEEEEEEEEEAYGTYHDPHDVVKKHYTAADVQREQLDEETREMMRRQDRRREMDGGGLRFEEMSAAEMAEEIENRHRMQRRTVSRDVVDAEAELGGGGGEGQFTAVSQQSLVPSVSDPSLWMYNCIPGKEQELVVQLMNKCAAFARQGKPLGITAAVAAQTKGKIYIESYSEPSVIEAVQGVRNLMQSSMRLVPINDMTTVMTVVPKKKPVKKNDWVRMTRGHYKGDLALVVDVKDGGLKAVIQCVPRIDLTLADLPAEEARIRRRTVRPPQKFFNPSEIAALGRAVERRRFPGGNDMCDFYEGSYYHDGYFLKEVTVGSMIKPTNEEEPPNLDELQRFRRRKKANVDGYDDGNEDENEGSRMAASLLDELSDLQGKTGVGSGGAGGGLIIGDTVEVIEGDLVGMRGKLLSLDGTTVKVKPSNAADLGETAEVEFLASQVRKYIPVGAHVKVIDGRYANETGEVVAVEQLEGETDCTAVILTDMTHKEVSVRTSQLQESAEVASGQDKLAGYELHDLVVLSGGGSTNEVGVITRVGREEFTVINNHGIVREVRPEELRGKRNSTSDRAVALDVQGNQIRVGDTVNIAEGPYKGRSATIKRMSRAQLFLYSQTRQENAGVFVVRSRSCVLAGSRQSRGGSDMNGDYNPRSAQGGARGGKKDDGLIGKTVRIQSGQWKGYLGAVADATPTHVSVELHTRLKKVMVLRERVAVAGDKFGATDNPERSSLASSNAMAPSTPFLGGATPMHGGATPMHGGATPMHDGVGGGGFTPSHSDSATDDVWRPGGDIDRTPMREDSNGVDGLDDPGSGSGWGSSSATNSAAVQQADPFAGTSSVSGVGDSGGGGWGVSSNEETKTWAPTTNESSPRQDSLEDAGANGSSGISPSQQDTKSGVNAASSGTTGEGAFSKRKDASATVDGSSDPSSAEAAVWFMERVCVKLERGDATGVIKEINSNNSAVVELADKSSVTVRSSEVSLIAPKEHDMVLVTGGADVGVEGELVCIDGTDAILKDSNEDFKIVDLVHLAKIEGDA